MLSIISVHKLERARVGTSLIFAHLHDRFRRRELVCPFNAYEVFILKNAVPGHDLDSWTYGNLDRVIMARQILYSESI